jgi:hypothetical protein
LSLGTGEDNVVYGVEVSSSLVEVEVVELGFVEVNCREVNWSGEVEVGEALVVVEVEGRCR